MRGTCGTTNGADCRNCATPNKSILMKYKSSNKLPICKKAICSVDKMTVSHHMQTTNTRTDTMAKKVKVTGIPRQGMQIKNDTMTGVEFQQAVAQLGMTNMQ